MFRRQLALSLFGVMLSLSVSVVNAVAAPLSCVRLKPREILCTCSITITHGIIIT